MILKPQQLGVVAQTRKSLETAKFSFELQLHRCLHNFLVIFLESLAWPRHQTFSKQSGGFVILGDVQCKVSPGSSLQWIYMCLMLWFPFSL